MKFYDRVNELAALKISDEQSKDSAVFTVLMGRRRIGKTSLVLKSMEDLK